MRSDLAFLLLLSFVPHGMYGTPPIKLPTKSSLQHTLGLQTCAQNLNQKLLLPTEDVKLLRRNLRACLQEVTSSFRLFKLFAYVFFCVRFWLGICVEVAVDRISRISIYHPLPALHSLPLFFVVVAVFFFFSDPTHNSPIYTTTLRISAI